ncbi:MAG: M28 family metallopeptidase, partial [Anaerolineae bacterium]
VIVGGHHDSAVQFNWLTYLGFGYYLAMAFIFISLVSILVGTGTEFFSLLLSGKSLSWTQQSMSRICTFVGPLGFISAFFFIGSKKNGGTVPGAADNLSACAVALGVGRVLMRHPELIPPDTEVRMITFGAEEAGTRGSLRYVERHLEELRKLDARVCNLDTIIRPKIVIHTTDGNSLVKNSPEVYNGLRDAARAAGVPHAKMPFPTFGGGTDTLPFSRHGIKAASLLAIAVPGQMIRWYHTPRDQYTLYEDEKEGGTVGLSNALKLCVEWIRPKA